MGCMLHVLREEPKPESIKRKKSTSLAESRGFHGFMIAFWLLWQCFLWFAVELTWFYQEVPPPNKYSFLSLPTPSRCTGSTGYDWNMLEFLLESLGARVELSWAELKLWFGLSTCCAATFALELRINVASDGSHPKTVSEFRPKNLAQSNKGPDSQSQHLSALICSLFDILIYDDIRIYYPERFDPAEMYERLPENRRTKIKKKRTPWSSAWNSCKNSQPRDTSKWLEPQSLWPLFRLYHALSPPEFRSSTYTIYTTHHWSLHNIIIYLYILII